MHSIKAKYVIKYLVFTFFACLCIVAASFFYNKSKGSITKLELTYNEKTDVDYNVYLKKNNFFEQEYLSKEFLSNGNKTVITQLIDYITINYSYSMNFSSPVSGKYTYYIKAIIEANKANSEIGNYWSKEYILTNKNEVELKDTSNYNIFTDVKIDYDEYNDLLTKFKKEFAISADGMLKVLLVVENDITDEKFNNPITIDTDTKLEIPLTRLSAEININSDNANKSKTLHEEINNDDFVYKIYFIIMILCLIVTVLFIILLISAIADRRKEDAYYIKLSKILSTYDSIIVNVSCLPDMSNFNVVKVSTFEELIDAHSEVRMPINYYREKNRDTFVLINGDMLWIYTLHNRRSN